VLLLLGDGTRLPVTELPGLGPWTFLVLQPSAGHPGPPPATPDPAPEPGAAARFLARYGRAVVPDLRGRPGFGEPPGTGGFLELVDDLDQIRTRAGLGRPVLVGLGALAPVALRAAADQPWAWRALVLAPAAGRPPRADELDELDLPVLQLADPAPWDGREPAAAVERLLGRLGGEPGWAGIAPDAPPR